MAIVKSGGSMKSIVYRVRIDKETLKSCFIKDFFISSVLSAVNLSLFRKGVKNVHY